MPFHQIDRISHEVAERHPSNQRGELFDCAGKVTRACRAAGQAATDIAERETDAWLLAFRNPDGGDFHLALASVRPPSRRANQPYRSIFSEHIQEYGEVGTGPANPIPKWLSPHLLLTCQFGDIEEGAVGGQHVALEIRDDKPVG